MNNTCPQTTTPSTSHCLAKIGFTEVSKARTFRKMRIYLQSELVAHQKWVIQTEKWLLASGRPIENDGVIASIKKDIDFLEGYIRFIDNAAAFEYPVRTNCTC